MIAFLIVLASYLIGSIPFGLVGGFFLKFETPEPLDPKTLVLQIFSEVVTKKQQLSHFSLICLKVS